MAESGSSYSKWWQQSSKAACGISGQCMALVSLGFCSSLSSLSFVGGGVGIRWPEAGVGICRDEGEGETRERDGRKKIIGSINLCLKLNWIL